MIGFASYCVFLFLVYIGKHKGTRVNHSDYKIRLQKEIIYYHTHTHTRVYLIYIIWNKSLMKHTWIVSTGNIWSI